MELGLHLWGHNFWLCCALVHVFGANGEMSHAHSTLSVSTPHLFYNCPEGATVKLPCSQKGAALHPTDSLKHAWLFTPHSDQHCTGRMGPRKIGGGHGAHPHGNHTLPPGLQFGSEGQVFWMRLQNVTHADQGRYCCVVLDVLQDNHHNVAQRAHNHIVLHITPRTNGSQVCSFYDLTPTGGSVPVALAIAACILALLSLPLILLLVYKQRHNAQSSRRAQELVRMDSEAQGHENPVFLGGSPHVKTRTVSQIMTRQPSETGRHLLSEPGTPLSPPTHGDVFFPIEDTIPESPDFL